MQGQYQQGYDYSSFGYPQQGPYAQSYDASAAASDPAAAAYHAWQMQQYQQYQQQQQQQQPIEDQSAPASSFMSRRQTGRKRKPSAQLVDSGIAEHWENMTPEERRDFLGSGSERSMSAAALAHPHDRHSGRFVSSSAFVTLTNGVTASGPVASAGGKQAVAATAVVPGMRRARGRIYSPAELAKLAHKRPRHEGGPRLTLRIGDDLRGMFPDFAPGQLATSEQQAFAASARATAVSAAVAVASAAASDAAMSQVLDQSMKQQLTVSVLAPMQLSDIERLQLSSSQSPPVTRNLD